jgi:hypothetical protein
MPEIFEDSVGGIIQPSPLHFYTILNTSFVRIIPAITAGTFSVKLGMQPAVLTLINKMLGATLNTVSALNGLYFFWKSPAPESRILILFVFC